MGTTGEEQYAISTDTGSILATGTLADSWTELSVAVPLTTQWVRIDFVNDGLTSAGADRNMIVDWFEIDGNIGSAHIETEADEVYSRGVWNGTDCDAGYRNSEFLACNGWFQFDVDDLVDPTTPPPPAQVEVSFGVIGSTGSEVVRAEINGEQVLGGRQVSGTNRTWFTVFWPQDVPISTVRVLFTNDGLDAAGNDRNLTLDQIWVDDKQYNPFDLESLGTWNGTDCGQGFRNSNTLHCNGWFEVVHDTTPPPPEDLEPITIVASGKIGTEELAISINGEFVTTFPLSTVVEFYSFDIPIVDEGPLRVEFFNDAIDSLGDRDVYIESIKFRGVTHHTPDLFSRGVWNGTDCNTGYRNSYVLNCNGWFQVPLDGDPPPPDGPTVPGRIISYGFTGTEQVGLEVNGEVVETWTVRNDGVGRELNVEVPDGGFDRVRVLFLNDGLTESGADRNLRINWIEFDGLVYNPFELLSKGHWNGVDCGEGYRNTDTLHCDGWFDLGIGDDDPPPPPPERPDIQLACLVRPATDGSDHAAYEWTWINPYGTATLLALETEGDRSYYAVSAGVDRFVHEVADLGRVSLVTIDDSNGQPIEYPASGTTCDERGSVKPPVLIASSGPGDITFTTDAGMADDKVNFLDFILRGDGYADVVKVTEPDGGYYSATFTGFPTDEVLVLEIRTCYGDVANRQCGVDEVGVRYHALAQIFSPGGAAVENTALGAPTDLVLDPVSDTLSWTAPADTDGEPFTYQVRSFYEGAYDHLQFAVGTLHPDFTEERIDTTSALLDDGLRYTGFPDANHRFQARACSTNGCGPWSASSDWISLDGTITPYEP